jgi:hypothetical protein
VRDTIQRSLLSAGLALLLGGATGAAWAQSGTAAISGVVTDATGATVPGAAATITNASAGISRSTITGASGRYQFSGLPPGEYELTVSLTGFSSVSVSAIGLRVDMQLRQDIELAIGEMSEVLTVEAESPLVNRIDASIGNTLDQKTISELPVEGRSVVELLSLQPGAVFIPFVSGTSDGEDPRYGSVSGARSDQQNVTLDGVDVNDPQLQSAYSSAVRVTQEALQEFRVSTSNYGANYGRSSGAQVSMVTRSGTNEFHGSGYWYGRRTGTSSNEYFLKLSQLDADQPNEAPKLDKDIFGGSFGGPIVEDRLFFFLNYEQLREQSERPVVRSVPSASFRDGVLMYQCDDAAACPGGSVAGFDGSHQVPAGFYGLTPAEIAAIDPLGIGPSRAVSDYFNQFPLPNEPGLDGVNIMDFRFPSPLENRFKTYMARLDARLDESGRQNMFLRFNAQDDAISDPEQYPGSGPRRETTFKNWGMAIGHDWAVTNELMNTFRYGYTRIDEANVGQVSSNLVSFRFIDSLIPFTYNEARQTPLHNFVEELSWLKGDHTIKLGANVRFVSIPSSRETSSWLDATINPSWVAGVGRTYQPGRPGCTTPGCLAVPPVSSRFVAGYADAWLNVLGVLSQANLNANYLTDGTLLDVGTPVSRRYRTNEYDFYIQDRWQVASNLTVTAGLRYSLYTPPWEVDGQQVAPTPSMGEWFAERERNMQQGIPSTASPLVTFDLAGKANGREGFYATDKNNFGPSLAIAWTPKPEGGFLGWLTGSEELTIRAGYSKVFDRIGTGLASRFDEFLAFGMSTGISSPFGAPYEEDPAVRFVDITTMPPTMPEAPPGGFPQTPPVRAGIITSSIDSTLETPSSHMVNLAISRQLGSNFSIEAAYVGRFGRDQLVRADLAMPLNLTDPASGQDYFGAAQQLINSAEAAGLGPDSDASEFAAIGNIPYWENLFPDLAGDGLSATQGAAAFFMSNSPDYITALWAMDQFCFPACSIYGPFAYFAEQYDSLAGIRSVGRSNYHALQMSLRKRYSNGLKFDVNYTLSTSKDMSSQAERGATFGNFGNGGYTGFLLNSWDPELNYSFSDYDVRHQINANWIWDLPIGDGPLLGGWSLSGLARWTSGFPFNVFNCRSCWTTNWNLQGNAELATPGLLPPTATTLGVVDGRPSPFEDPEQALGFFRNALPGEVGIRNLLRGDGFFSIDLSLSKAIPIGDRARIRFRADVFNVTNTPSFDVNQVTMFPDRSGFGRYDGSLPTCDALAGRCMQFAARVEF